MKERAFLLGPNESMLGIVSEPDAAPAPERPTLVILNSGIVHRIGPHRKSVKLARSLCEAGFRAVRFDLSGIGDSAVRRDALSFSDGALADISELFDDLATRVGATTFVLMGLCSGADNSFYGALHDERVVGAVILDGIAYRTPRYYVEHYRDRMTTRAAWVSLGKRASQAARARLRQVLDRGHGEGEMPTTTGAAVPDYVREFEPREVVCAKFQQLVDRGVKMYWGYTSGTGLYYNYASQFFDMFKAVDMKDRVTHEYFQDSNHTFTEIANQNALVSSVTRWTSATF